jgi:hypothetical protein
MTWRSGSSTLGGGGDSDDMAAGFGGAVVAWQLWMAVTWWRWRGGVVASDVVVNVGGGA